MTGKLEGLVIPVMEPLGYPHGWAGEAALLETQQLLGRRVALA